METIKRALIHAESRLSEVNAKGVNFTLIREAIETLSCDEDNHPLSCQVNKAVFSFFEQFAVNKYAIQDKITECKGDFILVITRGNMRCFDLQRNMLENLYNFRYVTSPITLVGEP